MEASVVFFFLSHVERLKVAHDIITTCKEPITRHDECRDVFGFCYLGVHQNALLYSMQKAVRVSEYSVVEWYPDDHLPP